MNSKKVLTHLIRAGRDALNLENVLNQFGYKETPYFNLYGEIAEAIYALIDEKAESFDQSVTHAVMHDPLTSDDASAEQLAKLLDNVSSFDMDIPQQAKEFISETAAERGLDFATMVRIILCEWTLQQILSK